VRAEAERDDRKSWRVTKLGLGVTKLGLGVRLLVACKLAVMFHATRTASASKIQIKLCFNQRCGVELKEALKLRHAQPRERPCRFC
jgi:hypothetical protein